MNKKEEQGRKTTIDSDEDVICMPKFLILTLIEFFVESETLILFLM